MRDIFSFQETANQNQGNNSLYTEKFVFLRRVRHTLHNSLYDNP